MSLKLVGIMALAGISAVAAYLILVRKKDEESTEEQDEAEAKTSEKEQSSTPSSKGKVEVEEVGIFPLEVNHTASAAEDEASAAETVSGNSEIIAAKINDEVETGCGNGDLNNKTESLMEWIDRQLAESRSRNSTPAPELPSKEAESSEDAIKVHKEYSSNGTKDVEDLDEYSTPIKEKENDNSLDSIEIIEMTEVENVEPLGDIVQTRYSEEPACSSSSNEIQVEQVISVDENKTVATNGDKSSDIVEQTTHEEQTENVSAGELVAPSEYKKTESDLSNESPIEIAEKDVEAAVTTIASASTEVNNDVVREQSETESKLELEDLSKATNVETIESAESDANINSGKKEEIREIVNDEITFDTGSSDKEIATEEYKDVVESDNFVEPLIVKSGDDVNDESQTEPKDNDAPVNISTGHSVENVGKVSSDKIKYEVTNDISNDSNVESEEINTEPSSVFYIDPAPQSDNSKTSTPHSSEGVKEIGESLDSSEKIIKTESVSSVENTELHVNANLWKSEPEKGTAASTDETSEESSDETDLAADAELAKSASIANITDISSINDSNCNDTKKVDDDSDMEIQLLKGSSDNKSYILEDSDSSGNYSDSGSYEENTTKDTPSDSKDEDCETKLNGSQDELNDSIGLMLRPSWQLKNTKKVKSAVDAKLTSI